MGLIYVRAGSPCDKADPQVDAIYDQIEVSERHCCETRLISVRIADGQSRKGVRTDIPLDYSGVTEVDHKVGKQEIGRRKGSRSGATALGQSCSTWNHRV